MTQGIVDIHGRQYKTVAKRVSEFRSNFKHCDKWAITTELIVHDETRVVMKASITDPDGVVVGTGHAEEMRQSSKINRTSAMENCESSAIGRALAAIGLGGEEYASADEVMRAIEQQEDLPEDKPQPVVTDDNTDVIKQRVKDNIEHIIESIGEEAYKTWHDRVLSNFYGCDSIEKLSADDLADFSVKQMIKIMESKE